MTECEIWLAERLKGPIFVNSERIKAEARNRGFTKGQLNAARKTLGVATASDRVLQGGEAENWFWLIPKEVEQE